VTWKDEWRRVFAIVWKDLTTERRSKAGINAVAFMGILVLLMFGFALGPDTEALRGAAAGALWLPSIGPISSNSTAVRSSRCCCIPARDGRSTWAS
jgi:hypothetical protein